MQRENTTVVMVGVAAAIAAVLAILWFARDDGEAAPSPIDDPADAIGAAGSPPGNQAGPEQPATPFSGPRVVVAVQSKERFVEPPPTRVQALQLPRREPLLTTLLAGTGANPWNEERRPGVAMVKVAADGGFLVRQVGVQATGITPLEFGGMLAVTGRVRDEAGQPIADARVWLGDLDASGKTRHLRTDAQGAFEARVRASDGVPLTVWAPGYAAAWMPIRVDVDGGRDHTVTLAAGGTLTMQIAGQTETAAAAEVFIAPSGPRDAGLSRYPFFLQGLVGGADIDASGRGSVSFLPRRGSLGLYVVHPNVAIEQHHEVQLDGERTACVVPVQFLPTSWSGVLHDDDGEPIPGATVLLRPEGRKVLPGSGLLLLPPWLAATGCVYAECDQSGAFSSIRPAPGSVLSLRAFGHAGRDIAVGVATAMPTTPLSLPKWVGGDLVVKLQPPQKGTAWRAEFDVGGGTVIDCAPDQVAVVSLPHHGRFDITLTTYEGDHNRGERVYRAVCATGPVVVQAPAIE